MTTKIVEVTKFVSNDGRVFDSKNECLYHEKKILFTDITAKWNDIKEKCIVSTTDIFPKLLITGNIYYFHSIEEYSTFTNILKSYIKVKFNDCEFDDCDFYYDFDEYKAGHIYIFMKNSPFDNIACDDHHFRLIDLNIVTENAQHEINKILSDIWHSSEDS